MLQIPKQLSQQRRFSGHFSTQQEHRFLEEDARHNVATVKGHPSVWIAVASVVGNVAQIGIDEQVVQLERHLVGMRVGRTWIDEVSLEGEVCCKPRGTA